MIDRFGPIYLTTLIRDSLTFINQRSHWLSDPVSLAHRFRIPNLVNRSVSRKNFFLPDFSLAAVYPAFTCLTVCPAFYKTEQF